MRALLLAAGRGERMRPLTDAVPKPLLKVAGRALIEWQIDALVRAGVCDIVINTAHLGRLIEDALADGSQRGAKLRYSREGEQAQDALETLGGIVKALPLLGDEPFIVASGDIITDFDYSDLAGPAREISSGRLDAHFVLVPNPPYHRQGDLGIADSTGGLRATRTAPRFTYGNIAVLSPRIFGGLEAVRSRMFPWLFATVDQGRAGAQLFEGRWFNVGTPRELHALDKMLG